MRFGILLDYCNKHLDVQFLSKVYLVLFLGEAILEPDKESFLTPEGVHCFLHRLALCRVSRGAEGERSGHLDGRVASVSGRNDGLKTPGSGQPDRHGVEPRVLDPYGTPAQGASQGVNPFWSDGVQRAVHSQGDHGAASGNNGVQSFDAEVEKLKAKCLREAEEAFAREVKKLGVAEKTEAESYHTASSSQGMQKVPNGSGGAPADGRARGAPQGPEPPPGLTSVRIGFDGTVGPTVSESLRHLELPALPVVGSDGAALQFGDWMTMAFPLMSDLGISAKGWWERSVAAAEDFLWKMVGIHSAGALEVEAAGGGGPRVHEVGTAGDCDVAEHPS